MKKVFVLLATLLIISSCSDKTVIENDMLTVEDTVIESITELETGSGTVDISTISFTGNGTEPFWGFSASGSTVVLREPSDTGPMDTTVFTGVVMTASGTSVNMLSADMNLDLVLGSCSDGMSDIVYDYSSSFVAGSLNYIGCANID